MPAKYAWCGPRACAMPHTAQFRWPNRDFRKSRQPLTPPYALLTLGPRRVGGKVKNGVQRFVRTRIPLLDHLLKLHSTMS